MAMNRAISRQNVSSALGDTFVFSDLSLSIYQWRKLFFVYVRRPGKIIEDKIFPDEKIANLSFNHIDDAIEMGEYIIVKIMIADALLSWIGAICK
jgi:hypothetical protein